MMLLFWPAPPRLQWCVVSRAFMSTGATEMTGDWTADIDARLPSDERLLTIGHVLQSGGDRFTCPCADLSPEALDRMEEMVPLMPDHNSMSVEVCRRWMERYPDVRHLVLCDTAFFARLPDAVRDYALPYEITRRGLHRYGGFGLCHEHSWRVAEDLSGGRVRRVVSVYLGGSSNLAAIKDGLAVETTIGLTYLEGLMSSRGCGEIDPTIIFQLGAAGASHGAISRLLSQESGFAGLAGGPCGLETVAASPSRGSRVSGVRRQFVYQLVKHAGAMVSVLGGVDALVFVSEKPDATVSLVWEVCDALAFLGIRHVPTGSIGPVPMEVSTKNSTIKVIAAKYNRWDIVADHVRRSAHDGKEQVR